MEEEKFKKIYELEKKSYYDIAKKFKEDGSNSFEKCVMRLKMLYYLKSGATRLNLKDELKSFEDEEESIKATLKKFGFEINAK